MLGRTGLTGASWPLNCTRRPAASAAAFAAVDALLLRGAGAAGARGGGCFLAGCAGGAGLPEPILRKLRTLVANELWWAAASAAAWQ